MKSFNVHFHSTDEMEPMTVNKLSEEDFDKTAAGGTRQLFELDTNIGAFIFLDAEDMDGNETYYALRYEGENETPSDIYSFELKDFYDMMALFMSQTYFHDENEEEEEEEYGPVHHLAHLLFHVVESGKEVNP